MKKPAGGRFQAAQYKKALTFRSELNVGVTYLPGQGKDCPAVKKPAGGRFQAVQYKKALTFRSELNVGVTYLPGQSPGKYCRRR